MCIITYKDNTHWAKLANCGNVSISVGYMKTTPPVHIIFSTPKTKKNILTWDVTFRQESYGEYTPVEKPLVVTTTNEGSDKEKEELETVHMVNNNNSLI